MPDTAQSLAREMIEEIGYIRAVVAAIEFAMGATSWRGFRRGFSILVAVVFA